MTVRLQAATSSSNPILLRTDAQAGHGIGTALAAQIAEGADVYTCVVHALGTRPPPATAPRRR